MVSIVLAIALVGWVCFTLWHFIDLLQYFQLHEYLNRRFLDWALHKLTLVIYPAGLMLPPLMLLAIAVPQVFQYLGFLSGLILIWVAAWGYTYRQAARRHARAIKPLVFTGRVRRLVAAGIVVILVEMGGLFWVIFGASPFNLSAWPQTISTRLYLYLLALLVVGELNFLNLPLANLLLTPLEEALRAYYIRSAERIIRAVNPVVIGITGSYGKTSTKEILYHLLAGRTEVLKTPRTFNTIMGVCKVIREELRPTHRFFIVEMGAYKKGEIARICRLVRPQIGILTAIGPQHLERFKTLEAIAQAKNELMEALPTDGVAIFNGNDPHCRELAIQAHSRVVLYGIEPEPQPLDLAARGLSMGPEGTAFEMVVAGEAPQPARLPLLGRHNVSNALAAIAGAQACGISTREVLRELATASPAEHRLQVVRNPGGIVTIDNAYSSNPSGARVALEVLASFPQGRKILVTPGFAELGSIQAEEHASLGRLAAKACDMIFLIGGQERVEQIMKGIREAGFDLSQVYCYNRLREARQKLTEISRPGDTILFENDLPDIY